MLSRHGWRGNVRELKNLIYRLVVTAREEELSETAIRQILRSQQGDEQDNGAESGFSDRVKSVIGDLMLDGENGTSLYVRALEQFERPMLEEILRKANGNQIKAAHMLGINRNTLRKKLTEYEIDPTQSR